MIAETETELGPVAPRPEPRTVIVGVAEGRFAGWKARVLLDWPAELLEEFTSGDMARIMAGAERIIVEHNFPTTDGTHAPSLAKVDPVQGLLAVLKLVTAAVQSADPT